MLKISPFRREKVLVTGLRSPALWIAPAVALLAILLSHPLRAEIYKWTDAEGSVHYSEDPPPEGIDSIQITPPPAPPVDNARQALESRVSGLDKRVEQRRQQAEAAAEARQQLEQRAAQCAQARARLASYERPRVTVVGADGERRVMAESERQAEISRARSQVEELCSGTP